MAFLISNVRLFIQKQVRFVITILLLIGFINVTYSQNGQHKTILYEIQSYNPTETYSADGYVSKSKFVENQNLTFRMEREIDSERILRDTIISGRYFSSEDGNSYIEGIWKNYNRNLSEIVRVKGIFRVSNNANDIGINTNKKKGKQLIIHILSNSPYYINIKRGNISLESNTPYLEAQRLYPNTFEKEILNDENVKLSFENEDVFMGTLQEGWNEKYGYIPDKGKYIYSTGEVCTGTFYYSDYYRKIFLEKGKTVFTDGSIGKDNWILQYDLSSNEREEIENSSISPTEKLIMVKIISAEKEQKLLVKKIELEQKNQQIIRNNMEIQRNIIKKYGDYWGNIIYKKEYTPGMTKEMVLEFTNDKYYKISKLIRNGISIEIWEFSKQKMMSEIIKSGDKNETNNLLVFSQYENMGLVDNLESGFPTLVFSNGKLTDVYQN